VGEPIKIILGGVLMGLATCNMNSRVISPPEGVTPFKIIGKKPVSAVATDVIIIELVSSGSMLFRENVTVVPFPCPSKDRATDSDSPPKK
jgi:hypothetical protein